MIIIAFSENSSKILPNIFCRRFRHCAPIICTQKNMIMYQFVKRHRIVKIPINTRDITILRAHGWQFVYVSPGASKNNLDLKHVYSCVDLSKRTIGIKSTLIQTPYALYKYLTRK